MTAPKFCKDCKHRIGDLLTLQSSRCAKCPEYDLVSGDKSFALCTNARAVDDLCGPDAWLFEARGDVVNGSDGDE